MAQQLKEQVVEKVEVRWPALIHSELWRPPSAGTAVRSRPGSVGCARTSSSHLHQHRSTRPRAGRRRQALHRPALSPPAQAVLERTLTKKNRKDFLSTVGPFLLVVTFVEDGLRIFLRWGEQIHYMTSVMNMSAAPAARVACRGPETRAGLGRGCGLGGRARAGCWEPRRQPVPSVAPNAAAARVWQAWVTAPVHRAGRPNGHPH